MGNLGDVLLGVALAASCLAYFVLRKIQRYAVQWRERFASEVESSLRSAFFYVDGRQIFQAYLAGLLVCTLILWLVTQQLIWVFVTLLCLGVLPRLFLQHIHRVRMRCLAAQLPDAILLLAGALRAGSSLVQAIGQAATEIPAPWGHELDRVMREQQLGSGLDAALLKLEARVDLEDIKLMVAALRIAQETGGNLSETLERLADTLRRKAVMEGKIDALTAQGRLQGWVMAALPVVVAVALCAIEPQAMQPLYSTWQGALFAVGLLACEAFGFYFIRRTVAIDV